MSPTGYTPDTAPFDSAKVSPSRVNSLLSCGIAFKLHYIDKVPEETSGSAALFGSVVHDALESWAPNREQDLLTLMRSSWLKVTEGTSVKDFIGSYAKLSASAIRQEHAIREAWAAKGKESKAPRMTKEWKESDVAKQINRLLAQWIPRLEAESPWRFSEHDPLPGLYDESLVLARRHEARWKHLPPALYTEFAFNVEWRGFNLNGHIDVIEALVNRESGEFEGIGIGDYKTYKKEPAEHKDYRQVVMYDVAVREMVASGQITLPFDIDQQPLLVFVDYVRLGERTYWQIHGDDHDRLERELIAYKKIVDAEAFLPAEKGRNPDFCGYPGQCCLRNTVAAGGGAERVEVSL